MDEYKKTFLKLQHCADGNQTHPDTDNQQQQSSTGTDNQQQQSSTGTDNQQQQTSQQPLLDDTLKQLLNTSKRTEEAVSVLLQKIINNTSNDTSEEIRAKMSEDFKSGD